MNLQSSIGVGVLGPSRQSPFVGRSSTVRMETTDAQQPSPNLRKRMDAGRRPGDLLGERANSDGRTPSLSRHSAVFPARRARFFAPCAQPHTTDPRASRAPILYIAFKNDEANRTRARVRVAHMRRAFLIGIDGQLRTAGAVRHRSGTRRP